MLQLKNISFAYNDNLVIKKLSFTVENGQNIAIIGESGCGKSTLLKLIYGLYDLKEGQIFYNEKEVLGLKFNLIPGENNMKYLAQDFDLMPYITVEENVGKFLSNIYNNEKKQRIDELLTMVEMTAYAKVKTKYLSGGQQQRVALARVLALEPEMILLDEPFSQIDASRKNALRRNLFAYLKKKKITCIIATHDSTDALSFSDETIVMQNGEILVKENPKNLYLNPTSKYVASLFGEVNEIPKHYLIASDDSQGTLLVYPHQLQISEKGKLKVKIKQSYFKGSHYLIKAVYNQEIIFFESKNDLQLDEEVSVMLKI